MKLKPTLFKNKDKDGISALISWDGPVLADSSTDKRFHIIILGDASGSMGMTLDNNLKGFSPSLSRGISTPISRPVSISSPIIPPNIQQMRGIRSPMTPLPSISLPQAPDIDSDEIIINSRSDILCKSLIKVFNLIKSLNEKGYDIKLSLISFSTEAEIVLEHSDIKDIHYSQVYEWFRPRYNTDFKKALDLMRELRYKYLDEDNISLLVSDGEHNGDYTKELLVKEYGKSLDMCIGIGSVEDYDDELLSNISKNSCIGAPDPYIFREHFTSFVFGSTTQVAINIEITIDGYVLTPANVKDNTIYLDDFHSHRIIPLYFPSNSTNVEISYIDESDSKKYIKKYLFDEKSEFLSDENGDEIYKFCKISKDLVSKDINSLKKEDIVEALEEIEGILENNKEKEIPEIQTKINNMLSILKKQLESVINTTNAKNFVSLMRGVSAQTSDCSPALMMARISDTISSPIPEYTEDNLNCLICYSNKRTTILRPCSHCVACTSCAIDMVDNSLNCPICRRTVNNLHILKSLHSKCLRCGVNSTNVYMSACGHGCLCKECMKICLKNPDTTCPECGILADRYICFILS